MLQRLPRKVRHRSTFRYLPCTTILPRNVTNLSTSSSLLSYSPVDPEAEIEALKEAVANLSGASMKIGQAIYSKKGDESTPDDENKKDDKKEDAQEAEFTEKKK